MHPGLPIDGAPRVLHGLAVVNLNPVYTWTWKSTQERESLVTVELRAKDGGTDLTLTHSEFADVAARDAHEKGWNGCLARLERYLA